MVDGSELRGIQIAVIPISAREGTREVNFFQWTPPPSVYHSNPCICKDLDRQPPGFARGEQQTMV